MSLALLVPTRLSGNAEHVAGATRTSFDEATAL